MPEHGFHAGRGNEHFGGSYPDNSGDNNSIILLFVVLLAILALVVIIRRRSNIKEPEKVVTKPKQKRNYKRRTNDEIAADAIAKYEVKKEKERKDK